jgi:hypothetical protein
LELASEAIKLDERRFKAALRDPVHAEAFKRDHRRPSYETRGGPAGDRSQMEVLPLRGKTLAAARDTIVAVMTGVTPSSQAASDTEEEADETAT